MLIIGTIADSHLQKTQIWSLSLKIWGEMQKIFRHYFAFLPLLRKVALSIVDVFTSLGSGQSRQSQQSRKDITTSSRKLWWTFFTISHRPDNLMKNWKHRVD